ncbi:MAG: SpoVR family protein [Deltaproteobacteria bacterium RIFCSPLOWO2_02_FULL_44_10]|nr:MAG: SpoVR family protein [Deltaproteobacteria bacterium RIFCSPHIGHO2_02_FULL_44_16]OGQ46244.1 MAG: SpoVR family protein [Deltaproteobacteria bacterium RIFCSPLOWO2_02_FULL_44_10]
MKKYQTQLGPELTSWQKKIEAHARDYGLDFFDVIFEVVDWKQLNEIAAFGGFPNRYPHWRFGMEYEELSKSYAYGLSKIYEMVINNDPCYAYLLYSNALVDQKLVMGHVYAHCDFFKNNVYFSHTNRKMMDEMANHKTRVMRSIDRHGYNTVEEFIDCCLSLDSLIDFHAPAIRRRRAPEIETSEKNPEVAQPYRLKAVRPYLEKYVNPQSFLDEQQKQIVEDQQRVHHIPENPERDVMLFLLEYAPLDRWQRDILSMIREEAYYFAPQGQTKILNEGFASYWHSKLMTEKLLTDDEVIDYADHHSGTVCMQPGKLNPYKLGIELLRDVEERWNKGRFGKEYEECTNMVEKRKWDKKLGLGREKIFEVRRLHNDITFIDTFLTPEFCAKQKFFTFAFNVTADQYEIASREFEKIKQQLLFQLTNFGKPMMEVVDGNYKNRAELLLRHVHEGIDLRVDYAQETMKALFRIWQRPINVETIADGVHKILSFDGTSHTESRL